MEKFRPGTDKVLVKVHGEPVLIPSRRKGEACLGNSGFTRTQLGSMVEAAQQIRRKQIKEPIVYGIYGE